METVQVFLENFLDHFRFPDPSLPRMDLCAREHGQNPLMFFEWDSRGTGERSWWKRFELEVLGLAEMGFTQAWLPPPNKAMVKEGRGYDAYDLWDLGEFEQKEGRETRWGNKEELLQAVKVAKEHGIGLIVDAVLNHKLGADQTEIFTAVECDPHNRNTTKGPPKEIEGWTVFDFPGRGDQYSKLKWRKEHFTGVDWDHRTKTQGIYRITGPGHKGWSKRVDKELGNYDFLLGIDIDHRHPDVRQDFMAWGPWVLDTIGSNGFRLDAIKHMDRKFLLEFIRNVRLKGHKNLFAVAEFWSADYRKIKPYIRAMRGEVSFFDVPLHHNFYKASKQGPSYDLRKIFDKTIIQKRPGDAVTFVDNHDTQVGQSLESWVESSFKPQAYALILLNLGGYPCVFYGDLYPCSFHDPEVARVLKQLIHIRQRFAYGRQVNYIENSPQRNCVGFVRLGTEKHQGCAVLVSNATGSTQPDVALSMFVGKDEPGKIYRNLLGESGEITIDADGMGSFRCASGQVAVWARKND